MGSRILAVSSIFQSGNTTDYLHRLDSIIRSYNAMFKRILSELDTPTPRRVSSRPKPPRFRTIDFQAHFHIIGISLHVMHGTWLSWTFEDLLGYTNTINQRAFNYGIQLSGQRITLSGELDETGTLTPTDHSVKLALPSLRLSGTFQSDYLQGTLVVDHFRLNLKPQYVDDILVVQQKFGNDFNELVDVLASNQSKKSLATEHTKSSLSVNLVVRLEGFQIGLQGPSSTQYIQSPLVSASYRTGSYPGSRWRFDVREFRLSLVHDVQISSFDRNRDNFESASMTLGCVVHNTPPESMSGTTDHLTIKISQVHAVMAPVAIVELGNLIDHIQVRQIFNLFHGTTIDPLAG